MIKPLGGGGGYVVGFDTYASVQQTRDVGPMLV